MIRINKNESPLRPLSESQLATIINDSAFNFYPDAEYEQFKRAYADFYHFQAEQIIAGNGSDELIQKLMLIMPDGPVLTLNPDFFMYQAYAAQVKRPIHFVEAQANLTFDLDTILQRIEEVRPAFFIMSNQHNPTGKQYDSVFLQAIADKMYAIGGYFVIDEAYLDFGTAYSFEKVDHVLQMRTLSKAFGLAGLRLGVLISTASTIAKIKQIEHPYPLNTVTLKIALYMFERPEQTKQFINHQRYLAQRLRDMLNQEVSHLMTIFSSATNFVLTQGEAAESLGQYIYQHGFLPRFYDETIMQDYVRYSIATDEQLNTLAQLIKDWRQDYELSKNA